MLNKNILIITMLILSSSFSNAQNGTLDLTFDPGAGADSTVRSVLVQSNGMILIGGDFDSYNGVPTGHLARLYPDGSLDQTFISGTGVNDKVHAIMEQSDGKLLIGGYFNNYNGNTSNNILRLNVDGSFDSTFNVGSGPNSTVVTIAQQSDGKILIGGTFGIFNGNPTGRLIRLNTDGSADSTFNMGTGPSSWIIKILIQPDSKILICGLFTSYDGVPINRIARLNIDGTLDSTFNPGQGANDNINTVALQSNGKIIIGGYFTTYNGLALNRIVRLHPDGNLDSTFNQGTGVNDFVWSITMQWDDNFFICGNFNNYNGVYKNRFAKVNSDGTLDTNFIQGAGPGNFVFSAAMQDDGKIVIGGTFTLYDGINRNRVARVTNTIVGIEENNENNKRILLYPNPSNGMLNLVLPDNIQNGVVKIINVIGEEVSFYKTNKELNLHNQITLPSGLYVVIVSDESSLFSERLIVY